MTGVVRVSVGCCDFLIISIDLVRWTSSECFFLVSFSNRNIENDEVVLFLFVFFFSVRQQAMTEASIDALQNNNRKNKLIIVWMICVCFLRYFSLHGSDDGEMRKINSTQFLLVFCFYYLWIDDVNKWMISIHCCRENWCEWFLDIFLTIIFNVIDELINFYDSIDSKSNWRQLKMQQHSNSMGI